MAKKSLEEKIEVTKNVLKENLNTVRAGRANPAILNKVMVEYYGTLTPINQVSSVSVPEARQILIQPWDMSILKAVDTAGITLCREWNKDVLLFRIKSKRCNV